MLGRLIRMMEEYRELPIGAQVALHSLMDGADVNYIAASTVPVLAEFLERVENTVLKIHTGNAIEVCEPLSDVAYRLRRRAKRLSPDPSSWE